MNKKNRRIAELETENARLHNAVYDSLESLFEGLNLRLERLNPEQQRVLRVDRQK